MCTSMSAVLCRATLSSSSCISSLSIFAGKHVLRIAQNRRCLWSLSGKNCVQKNTSMTLFNQERFGSAGAISSGAVPGVLTKTQAKELAVRLTADERKVLIAALQECQSQKLKAEYEAETVPQPTTRELMRVSVANAIPFVGFGFLDNAIMIIAGDSIEATMGVFISLSTMTAAAFGNTISDILGIGSAFYVELLAQKIGFEPPKLTPIQLDLPKSRRAANFGRVFGVTIGCLLGMLPLLILHKEDKKDEPDKEPPNKEEEKK
ncbi:transmembrane protein 65 isoform X4 [Nasonia vitripennis]|uniref:Transmembrane protein 65 n=1 Tax=Nasonia vitripennis TaxID=7425 RepID=A0A7M7HHG5_NASVI|nr:transmembrane protein 65 isoform X4 [Nasonia vitripennis]